MFQLEKNIDFIIYEAHCPFKFQFFPPFSLIVHSVRKLHEEESLGWFWCLSKATSPRTSPGFLKLLSQGRIEKF